MNNICDNFYCKKCGKSWWEYDNKPYCQCNIIDRRKFKNATKIPTGITFIYQEEKL